MFSIPEIAFYSDKQLDIITSLSRATRWRMRRKGTFPNPVHLSKGRFNSKTRSRPTTNHSGGMLKRQAIFITHPRPPLFAINPFLNRGVPTNVMQNFGHNNTNTRKGARVSWGMALEPHKTIVCGRYAQARARHKAKRRS